MKELDAQLFKACTAESIDFLAVESLLKSGANPLGAVEKGEPVYSAVIEHFLDMGYDSPADDSTFYRITELFLRYGMKIQSSVGNSALKPMWLFAFYSTETAMHTLKLLLDNGLDADAAAECWGHELTDLGIAEFDASDDRVREMASRSFERVMLIASYPHIIHADESLQKEIWFQQNQYDITNFRDWDRFEYSFAPTDGTKLNKSIVTITEKDTQNKVWKFGFEISPEEVKKALTER